MIISLRWLNEYVEISDYLKKPEELAEILTRAGLEVENIVNRAKDFDSVVTGHILQKDKHPNADKLSLCQVTTQGGVVHQIVCGAQNHKSGDKVVVALPGAVLPGNFAIKKAVVRGVESGGMLCSEKELGLSSESAGIIILPADAPIGKPFAEYKGLDDVTFELKVTPNRADCLSHYGLAREVGCLLSRPLKAFEVATEFSEQSTKNQIQLDVQAKDLCPRYCGRSIVGVKVGPSPDWLVKRLQSVGMNSINNVVDVTNYVMLELGQPLHAFDAQSLASGKVRVGKSTSGEKFQTLDGTELTLTGEELMIMDQQRSVAMAGVIGGKNSGVNDGTTELFIESAFFLPATVRKTARSFGLSTDSSYRFSRGVDPDATSKAMDRAIYLIQKVAGGVAYGQHYDVYPSPIKKHSISIDIQTVSDRLGYEASADLFESMMKRLGCHVEKGVSNLKSGVGTMIQTVSFQVLPPTYRFDLESEMDLVEEYARLNGYEHIPESLPSFAKTPAKEDAQYSLNLKMSESLRSQGFQQAMNYAFVSQQKETQLIQQWNLLTNIGLSTSEKKIRLMNPLSDDLSVMRSTLSFGLFQNMLSNYHQGNEVGRLFEIGKTFSQGEQQYLEHNRAALMSWGSMQGLWNKTQSAPLVFQLKSAIENLLSSMNIQSYQWLPFAEKNQIPLFLHQGQAAILVVEGKKVGFIGAVHPLILNENKIRTEVVMAEFDTESFLRGLQRISSFKSVSKFPAIERDLALVMKKSMHSADVVSEIKKSGGLLLQSTEAIDTYTGDKLDRGLKSITYRLRFQDKNATLQDEAVNKAIEAVLQNLKQKFDVSLR